jgi:uncharacterized membrane protein YdjX (TVP38/TMEM64 family)
MSPQNIRYLRLAVWVICVSLLIYGYAFRRELIQTEMQQAVSVSVLFGYALYLLLGCVRGFTLIPSANLVLLGIPFFRPAPLFLLTIIGIVVSSSSIYYFAGSLHFDEIFETKHKGKLERLKGVLSRNQMPIVIGWSFFPLAPTDLICYACGILRINFLKFVVGILIGEGTICGLYIFLGDNLLRFFHLR